MRLGLSAVYDARGGSFTRLRRLLVDWDASGAMAKHEVTVFALPATAARLAESLPAHIHSRIRLEHVEVRLPGPAARLVVEHVVVPRLARVHGIDVLFCTANVVPEGWHGPSAVLFQNAAPFCTGLSPSAVGWRYWLRFRLLRWFIRRAARRASLLICISEHFRATLERSVGVASMRPAVVVPSPREDVGDAAGMLPDIKQQLGIAGPYVLAVGHAYSYKNYEELILGFADAVHRMPAWQGQLVIVGELVDPRYAARLHRARDASGMASRICFAGTVASAMVAALLAGCDAFVFPSTCENSPQALVEALGAGAPVACADCGVMPEIAGPAARYFDPRRPEEIATALVSILADASEATRLRTLSLRRAAEFPSRGDVAASILALLESLTQRTPR